MALLQAWIFGAIAFAAILFSAKAHDPLFAFHMGLVAVIALIGMVWRLKTMEVGDSKKIPFREQPAGYMDDVIRAGVIATMFWGIVGFLVGLYIALELAYPLLNLDLRGRLSGGSGRSTRRRSFSPSAATRCSRRASMSCSARRARLFGGQLAWFVFWGYQVFIVAGCDRLPARYHPVASEYAEPEWYVDIWLTIVWVAYLLVFLGTILRRKEPHIYVANWFYLAFIITIAMLHVVNNLVGSGLIPRLEELSLFSGVQEL